MSTDNIETTDNAPVAAPAANGGEGAPNGQPGGQPQRDFRPRPYTPRPYTPRGEGDGGGGGGPRGPRRPRPGGRGERYAPRRKVNSYCLEHSKFIDYKDVNGLRRFLSERGKIEPRRKTGASARCQRMITIALKRARHMALLPFVGPHNR